MSTKKTQCKVKMYRMGTGDFFLLTFMDEQGKNPYYFMIDCGVKQISGDDIKKYVRDLHDSTKGNIDALLITHEHSDHVLGFQRAEEMFRNEFKINELWLPWTEKEEDQLVKEWKEKYGQKKKSLALTSRYLSKMKNTKLYENVYRTRKQRDPEDESAKDDERYRDFSLDARKKIADYLEELTELNTNKLGADDASAAEYKGNLKGMEIARSLVDECNYKFLETGSILENIDGLDNIRIYVLGPPKSWDLVKQEHGKEGETYKHNKELNFVNGFSCLPFEEDNSMPPFDEEFVDSADNVKTLYDDEKNDFRKIDFDWLMSGANLSLRLTRAINNLSAVLAIEFVDSGKVMLFPGDAEIGSWKSWHNIDWKRENENGEKLTTEHLLNRTVFYKVAHHASHNGTAKEKGVDMMIHPDLVAMATVNYSKIFDSWKTTMPNRNLVKDMLNKTKGRLLISSLDELYFDKDNKIPLEEEIEKRLGNMNSTERDQFTRNLKTEDIFIEFTVNGK